MSAQTNQQTLITAKLSLLPFLLFLGIFIGSGWYFSAQGVAYAFYQVPASIAIIPAIIFALSLGKTPFEQKLTQFIQGIGHSNIIAMCLIYLLAGAFASVAKASGSIDASVQLLLQLFPTNALLPALFIVAAIIATAMGTSMGTIAAVAPIALTLAEQTQLNPALVAGAIMSGAMFGDNLSMISDTTIAATRSQGARMKDKFISNSRVALPSALLTLLLLSFWPSSSMQSSVVDHTTDAIALLPYAIVLVMALLGINVFIVLTSAIILASILAYSYYHIAILDLITAINQGFSNMQDIMLLSLLIGGLSEVIKYQGGLNYLINTIEKWQKKLTNKGENNTPMTLALLSFCTNFFTANNTVSLILVGESAKQIAQDNNVAASDSASVLDIFACINQGLLPYGAQALLLASSFKLAPTEVVVFAFYPMALAVITLSFFKWQYKQ